jgi:hypothetical protein
MTELSVLTFSIKNKETKDHGLFRDAIEVIGKMDSTPDSPSIFTKYFASKYMATLNTVNGR